MQRSIGLELAASSGIYSKATSTTGTDWVQLAASGSTGIRCNQVEIFNDTGTTLAVRYCNSDGTAKTGQSFLTVATGGTVRLRGIFEAAQVAVKRSDDSNTPVTVKFKTEGVAAGV
ncbi:MAG: hypothetical protein EBR82_25425 [Caulobacteraceae bacterium]|nr:hypothetical protein [Caulobacteraceae bacterium]